MSEVSRIMTRIAGAKSVIEHKEEQTNDDYIMFDVLNDCFEFLKNNMEVLERDGSRKCHL